MRNCFNFDVENKQRIYQKVLTGGNSFKNKKRILEKTIPYAGRSKCSTAKRLPRK